MIIIVGGAGQLSKQPEERGDAEADNASLLRSPVAVDSTTVA